MQKLVPVLVLLFAQSAWAGKCDDSAPEHGKCLSDQVVSWCENGQVHTLECDDGEVCKWNEAVNAFDCLSEACTYDVDDDGDKEAIDITGYCVGQDKVVWCEGGKLRNLACGMGSACGWNSDLNAHDCMPSNAILEPDPPPETPDASTSGDEDANKSQFTDTARGTIPPIRHEDEPEATLSVETQPDAGCSIDRSAGAGWPAALWLLLLIGFAALRLGARTTRRTRLGGGSSRGCPPR